MPSYVAEKRARLGLTQVSPQQTMSNVRAETGSVGRTAGFQSPMMPGTRQVINKPLWDERRNEWFLLLFLKSPYGNFYVEFYYILHLYRLQVTFGGHT